MAERVALRIKNVAKAVLVSGQAYQDPKDALNEFVSNAADEYVEAGLRGEQIRIVLRRRGQRSFIAVEDHGRGMDVDRLRAIAQGLFESTKAGDQRTLGEKAIGILAFQQIAGRCEIVTRSEASDLTHSLRLERGTRHAMLEADERRRKRATSGTTVYLLDLDPEAAKVLTQRKVVDYLRRRRGPALARGDYGIVVEEGRAAELVTPEVPEGVRLDIPARHTLWGKIEFGLYVAARPDRPRRVAVVGRGGTTIVDDLAEIEEFARHPWTSDQVSGTVAFDGLQQSAGRRAVLRDREAFPVFVDALSGVEPLVAELVSRVAKEVDEEQAERLSDAVRKIFGRVLRELADLDNPMRTLLGSESGEGAMFEPSTGPNGENGNGNGNGGAPAGGHDLPDLPPPALPEPAPVEGSETGTARPDRNRSRSLPDVAVDPEPGEGRSRFDPEASVVLYNDGHPDYLLVKDEEAGLLDYLATLVAKEYVVYNNPRAEPDELAEEMVRMLVRVRRHLPKRR